MSDKIDQRIVEMSFENERFEEGIKQSKNSLKDFSNALKNTSKEDFSGLEHSVGRISNSFSAFREVAIGALRKIGEEAVMAGANLIKSIAIEPITQGFNEMELKMNSTQTMMASTGESLATVNGYLQELNEYADKTIYSFSDMTQNIGKFTNAGVKLDLAVASIKGISNAAALAGANANEASRAMYNFAQALSSGYVKLIDWKSIELANMATVEFKTQLLESAVAAGTLTKTANGMYKVLSKNSQGKTMDTVISATRNFNDSLSYQWMTTEALTKTLADYADETTDIGRRASIAATQVTTFTKLMDTLKEAVGSGWAQTFELIFGDFDEQRKLWTGINDAMSSMIGTFTDVRNSFLTHSMSTGWKQFMAQGISDTTTFGETLANVAQESGIKIDEILKLYGSMEEAVRHGLWLTGDMVTESVNRMAAGIENLSGKELLNAGYTEKTKKELLDLRDALKSGAISAEDFVVKMKAMSGRENIIDGLKNSVIALLKVLKPISEAFDQIFPPLTAQRFYQMTESFKEFTKQLIINKETADKIKRTFAGFFAVIDIGWQVVQFLAKAVMEVVNVFFPLGDGILDTTASIGDFLVMINRTIKSSKVFQYGLLAVKIAALLLRAAVITLVEKVSTFINALWNAEDPLQYLRTLGEKVFGKILESIKNVTSWISDKFSKALGFANDTVESTFGKTIVKVFSTIFDLFKSIGSFLSGNFLNGLDTFKNIISNIDLSKITTFVVGGILLTFVFQISRFVGASTKFVKALTNVAKGMSGMFDAGKPNVLRDLALAIGVLAASLWVLSRIPAPELTKSLKALAGAMGMFVIAYGVLQGINIGTSKVLKDKEMVKTAFNLIGFAAAVAAMANSVKIIAGIEKGDVWKAVGVIEVLVATIAAYQGLCALIDLLPDGNKTAKKSNSMANSALGIALGVLAMTGALYLINLMKDTDFDNALGKITQMMLVITAFQMLNSIAAKLSGGNKLPASILGISLGVIAMVGVFKLLTLINSDMITQGAGVLLEMGLIISALQFFMGLASKLSGGAKAKVNIISMSLGLAAMVGLLKLLTFFTEEELNTGVKILDRLATVIIGLEVMTAAAALISDGKKAQKILGSVVLTLGAFVGIIALTKIFTEEEINQGLLTIIKMAGIIVGIEFLSSLAAKFSGGNNSLKTLIGVSITVIALAGSLAIIAIIPEKDLDAASNAFAKVLGTVGFMAIGFGILTEAISAIKVQNDSIKKIIPALIVGFGAMVLLFVAAMGFFAILPNIIKSVQDVELGDLAKIGLVVTAMAGIMAAFVVLKTPTEKVNMGALGAAFISMIAIFAAMWGLFKILPGILNTVKQITLADLGTMGSVLLGMGAIMGVILLLQGPLTALGNAHAFVPLAEGVLTVLGILALIIFAFEAIAGIINLIDYDTLISGFEKLAVVGEGIGKFFGSIVGGFSEDLLEGVGEGIAALFTAISSVTPRSTVLLMGIADSLLSLTQASLLDGLSRLFKIDFWNSTGTSVGRSIKDLVTELATIPLDDVKNVTDVMTALKPMNEALKAMADAAKDIPNTGGYIDTWLGSNDIDDFGAMLAGFIHVFNGNTLGAGRGGGRSISTSGITVEMAKHATEVLQALAPMNEALKTVADAAKSIPNSGGFIGDFAGNNDIDNFAWMLARFVNVLSGGDILQPGLGGGTVGGITLAAIGTAKTNLDAIALMNDSLKTMATAAASIPNSGGYIGDWLGNNDIDTFGEQLAGFVYAMCGTEDKPLDTAKITEAATNLSAMRNMLPTLNAFADLVRSIEDIGSFPGAVRSNLHLKNFADTFALFVNRLSGIDYSIVNPALDSMNSVAVTFQQIGAEVLENAYESFENNKTPFQKAIVGIFVEPVKILQNKKKDFRNILSDIFDEMLANVDEYLDKFKEVGEDISLGLAEGIEGQKKRPITAVKEVLNKVTTGARNTVEVASPSKVFAEIGAWCTKGLAVGISSESKTAVKSGVTMAKETEEGIRDTLGVHSLSDIFAKIGAWVTKSIGVGIDDPKNWLLARAKDLGIDTSNLTLDGIIQTLTGGEGILTEGINSLLDVLTGSDLEELANSLGGSLGGDIVSGLGNSLSNGSSGIKATVKSELDKLKEFIEEENYYGRMSLTEELEAYRKLQTTYKEGSKERKAIDREIYRLSKSIYEAQIEYINGVSDAQTEAAKERKELDEDYAKDTAEANEEAAKKLADLQKKHDQDVLSARKDANEKMQDAEKSYLDDYNRLLDDAEKERQNTREEYADNQRSINEKLLSDIEAQNKAYEDAVKSRADAIYGSYGLFDEVTAAEDVSGEQLLQNLRDQGAALSEWQQSLAQLAERGVGDALIEELQQMGPSSTAQIKALISLTDAQLNEYVSLFQGKYAFARVKAEEELVGLKESTARNIAELNAKAAEDLANLELEFSTAMENIDAKANQDLSDLKQTYNEKMSEIQSDLSEKLASIQSSFAESSQEINTDLADKLSDLEQTYSESTTKINEDLEKKLKELKDQYSDTMEEVDSLSTEELTKLIETNKQKLQELNADSEQELGELEKIFVNTGTTIADAITTGVRTAQTNSASTMDTMVNDGNNFASEFENVGVNAAHGFANGILSGEAYAVMAAKSVANSAVVAMNNTLAVQSPSKVFAKIGNYVSMGFANGITDYAYKAKDASVKVATGVIGVVTKALSEIDDEVDSDYEFTPTITPILDLSNVKANRIADLLNDKSYTFAANSSRLARQIDQVPKDQNGSISTINNYFNLSGLVVRSESDIDAIATKLEQKQQAAMRGRGIKTVSRY